MNPKVIIPFGIGINSHNELGKAFKNGGADVTFVHINDLIKYPKMLDLYQLIGLPGGFMMGDQLGAGQSTRNRIDGTPLRDKLYEKLSDPNVPVYATCNSLQLLAKLDLFPVYLGTVKNASGKHETGSWDVRPNKNNNTVWLTSLKEYPLPLFFVISHGEGRIVMNSEELKKAQDTNLIALQYDKGHMFEYQQSSKHGIYNPNESIDDIAGVGWENNLVLFPHPERTLRNVQREDRALLSTHKYTSKYYSSTPDGLYEPTYVMFRDAVNFVK